MFEMFSRTFTLDPNGRWAVPEAIRSFGDDGLDQLMALLGGRSFNHGLYRILSAQAVVAWSAGVAVAFPDFSGRVTCFAVDWLGRMFALDRTRKVDGHDAVVMLEPGTGEALEIPCNLVTFHEFELIQYREEALAESFYKSWVASGGAAPNIDECVGYKRPLFLGGSDTVDNLTLSNLDVYWELATQLLQQVRGLPRGAPVSIKIS